MKIESENQTAEDVGTSCASSCSAPPVLPEFVEGFPATFQQPADLPEGLIGSRILQFGTTCDRGLEGGGLIIDYLPVGRELPVRVILEFNELAMWVSTQDGYRK
jgi:hypothetical protein